MRWAKRAAGSVLLCLAVTVIWSIARREIQQSAGKQDYAAAVAETEATDPDWRWADLTAKRRRPPPGKNGADLIPRIKALTPKGWGDKLFGAWEPLVGVPTNVRFSDEVLTEARRECTTADAAIALARSLCDYPDGHRDLHLAPLVINTLLDDTQATRLTAALLKWDVVLAVEDRNTSRAADSLRAMLNASRSIGDEPFSISQIVRIAVRAVAVRSLEWTLAQTELPVTRLAELQAAWADDATDPLLFFALRGERGARDQLVANLADGVVSLDDILGHDRESEGWFNEHSWKLHCRQLWADRAYLLRYSTGAVELARLPVHEQSRATKSLPEPPTKDLRVALSLLPLVDQIAGAYWRSVAEARCAVVGMACERFRLRHGRWPDALKDLTPDLLADVPLDPFDGVALRYKRLPDGVVVYSVGKDRADDGGNLSRTDAANGTDEGFRLWDPAHRHRPAPPAATPTIDP